MRLPFGRGLVSGHRLAVVPQIAFFFSGFSRWLFCCQRAKARVPEFAAYTIDFAKSCDKCSNPQPSMPYSLSPVTYSLLRLFPVTCPL